jgi:hypothetical protein
MLSVASHVMVALQVLFEAAGDQVADPALQQLRAVSLDASVAGNFYPYYCAVDTVRPHFATMCMQATC